MSRSYKKTPVVKDREMTPKSMVSRIIRRKSKKINSEISDGSAYKKYFDSWNIHDQVFYWNKEQATAYWNRSMNDPYMKEQLIKDYGTLENFLNKHWFKVMKRK